jgi:hypothetical protein
MGALHEGHASLVRQGSRLAKDRGHTGGCIVSIFVNPTQFNDPKDLERYPRTLEADLAICKAAGAAAVYAQPIALAYSGGLDTSCIVPWLKENIPGAKSSASSATSARALTSSTASRKGHATPARRVPRRRPQEEFVDDFVMPHNAHRRRCTKAATCSAPPSPAPSSPRHRSRSREDRLHRPLPRLHGQGQRPGPLRVGVSPRSRRRWKSSPLAHPAWNLSGRLAMLDYLKKRNIPTTASATKIYSRDRNLWHISHEGGAIEDPWNAPPDDAWMLTATPIKAPDKARGRHDHLQHGPPHRKLNGDADARSVADHREAQRNRRTPRRRSR